jgi:hypothetical protein
VGTGSYHGEGIGLRGNAFIVYEALSVILKNPLLDDRAKGNAVINLYVVVSGIYHDDAAYTDYFVSLDSAYEHLHKTYENFEVFAGGIEPQKEFWKNTNDMFDLLWKLIVKTGIIKDASQRNYVVPDD